ncbi:response regulator transcription factor [Solimonas soli]|uniref:response regulator transcription factor n=1 Tax=Solimonas soli TaxID=413479 RepID=UPI0004AC58AE|nr:response regulator transcription factor [Solimonas soli]
MRTLYIADPVDARLRQALRQAGHAVHTLQPGEADWAIAESRHQVIVCDLAVPDPARIRRWTALRPAHAVLLVIGGEHSPTPAAAVLRAGADACLRRPLALIELEARIQALLRRAVIGAGHHCPRARSSRLTIGLRARIASYGDRELTLPPREHALLFLLGRAADNAVSRDVLWQHLWCEESEPRPERIELYVSRLRRKLATLGAPNALQTLRGFGYRLQGPVSLR